MGTRGQERTWERKWVPGAGPGPRTASRNTARPGDSGPPDRGLKCRCRNAGKRPRWRVDEGCFSSRRERYSTRGAWSTHAGGRRGHAGGVRRVPQHRRGPPASGPVKGGDTQGHVAAAAPCARSAETAEVAIAGAGEGQLSTGRGASFWGEDSVEEGDGGAGRTTLRTYETHRVVQFEMVHLMLREFRLNKKRQQVDENERKSAATPASEPARTGAPRPQLRGDRHRRAQPTGCRHAAVRGLCSGVTAWKRLSKRHSANELPVLSMGKSRPAPRPRASWGFRAGPRPPSVLGGCLGSGESAPAPSQGCRWPRLPPASAACGPWRPLSP